MPRWRQGTNKTPCKTPFDYRKIMEPILLRSDRVDSTDGNAYSQVYNHYCEISNNAAMKGELWSFSVLPVSTRVQWKQRDLTSTDQPREAEGSTIVQSAKEPDLSRERVYKCLPKMEGIPTNLRLSRRCYGALPSKQSIRNKAVLRRRALENI